MKSRVLSRPSVLLSLALVALLVAALTWTVGRRPNPLIDGLKTSGHSAGEAEDRRSAAAAKKVPCGAYGKGKKCQDSDGDGIPDKKDKDDDNDGVKDGKDKDDDGDGVPDKKDNCPKVPNEGQANGDGDKKGNACDKKDKGKGNKGKGNKGKGNKGKGNKGKGNKGKKKGKKNGG